MKKGGGVLWREAECQLWCCCYQVGHSAVVMTRYTGECGCIAPYAANGVSGGMLFVSRSA